MTCEGCGRRVTHVGGRHAEGCTWIDPLAHESPRQAELENQSRQTEASWRALWSE